MGRGGRRGREVWEGSSPHLDALVQESLAQHPQGHPLAVLQVGFAPQHPVGGCVIDGVSTHVLLQRLEVMLQVMADHQFAFQELQDLPGRHAPHTCPPGIPQWPPVGQGWHREAPPQLSGWPEIQVNITLPGLQMYRL